MEDTSAIQRFDINEAMERLEKEKDQDKRHHRDVLKGIRKGKKQKQKAAEEEGDYTMDLADESEDEGSVDISWLPDPDKPKKFDDDSDADEPPKKKNKNGKTKNHSIRNAEEQALALLGLG